MNGKKKLLDQCKAHLEKMVNDLQAEILDAQQNANDYGTPRDRYDAYRTQMIRKRDMFAQQLAKVIVQVDVLNKVDPNKKNKAVEFGALVITSRQKLFISTGLGKIELEGEVYYAISISVPIYKAMEGKKEGDEFVFNGIRSKILQIF